VKTGNNISFTSYVSVKHAEAVVVRFPQTRP